MSIKLPFSLSGYKKGDGVSKKAGYWQEMSLIGVFIRLFTGKAVVSGFIYVFG
jgi:hypothetical protein